MSCRVFVGLFMLIWQTKHHPSCYAPFRRYQRHRLFACTRSDMRRNRSSRVGAAGVRSALLTEAMTFLEPWILRNNFNSAIKRNQVCGLPARANLSAAQRVYTLGHCAL